MLYSLTGLACDPVRAGYEGGCCPRGARLRPVGNGPVHHQSARQAEGVDARAPLLVPLLVLVPLPLPVLDVGFSIRCWMRV